MSIIITTFYSQFNEYTQGREYPNENSKYRHTLVRSGDTVVVILVRGDFVLIGTAWYRKKYIYTNMFWNITVDETKDTIGLEYPDDNSRLVHEQINNGEIVGFDVNEIVNGFVKINSGYYSISHFEFMQ
jgi:hypothetical protein